MGRRRIFVAATAVAVVAFAAVPAIASDAFPNDRVQPSVEPTVGPDGGSVAMGGRVGAVGFEGGVEADKDGARVVSPPWHQSVEVPAGDPTAPKKEREELYGPPGAAAALGTGGLTASFTSGGVLSNLSWPGPGFYDHVNHVNIARDWDNHGAPENAGSFGGLVLPDGTATWFTSGDGWEQVGQRYEHAESGVVRTELHRAADSQIERALTVVIRDVVHPESDVLARQFEVLDAPDGTSLLYYANMNPTTARAPKLPSGTDGAADNVSDFATAFHREGDRSAMLHFRPATIDPTSATAAVTSRLNPDNAAEAIGRTYGTGVYIAVGGDRAPADHHAGLETVGMVRGEAEGTALLDPFYDARDGDLSESDLAFGKTAGAQRWDGSSGTIYIAAASDAQGAVGALDAARQQGFDGLVRAAERDWAKWIRRARLPATGDAHLDAVNKRALMLIRTAQDRQTGAIVANTTVQTPYKQDWVRDGAFFNYALLAAGYSDMVERHNDFYRRAQTETGHWSPILCTDGAHCDAVFPFEIDAQGLGVWIQWMEYEFDSDAAALADRYESIAKGAEILYACQDPSNGMQCYAAEDDAVEPTQKAQGAATVFLGLRSAAKAARVVAGHDVARADQLLNDAGRWDARARELQEAVLTTWCTKGTAQAPHCGLGRGVIYLVWPGKVLLDVDEETATRFDVPAKLDRTLNNFRDQLRYRMRANGPTGRNMQPGEFFQYPMESLLALTNGADRQDGLHVDAVNWLGHHVAEPGVLHFGERIYYVGGEAHSGAGDYLHSVGFPHIWSGAEMYLASAMVHGLQSGVGNPCRATGTVGDIPCSNGQRRPQHQPWSPPGG